MGEGQGDLPSPIYKLNHIRFDNDSFHVASLNKSIPFFGACAIVSDTSGELVCYTNDINVYNRNHLVIQNGQGLQSASEYPFGYPFDQSVLILPLPDTSGQYIMIDESDIDIGIDVITKLLRYSLINMNINNGAGRVTLKINPITNTTDTLNIGFLVANRHANGKDWWLLSTKFESNRYRKFLITKSGIEPISDQIIGEVVHNGVGFAAYSPSGCWYAKYVAFGNTSDPKSEVFLYEFDRSTGVLSNPINKIYPGKIAFGGVSFSPNSRYLYVSNFTKIFQYDLHDPDILASETVVAEYDGFLDENGVPTRFHGLQLAPDNKIYGIIPGFNSRYIHVIDQPDLRGDACTVIQHAIYLPAHNFGTLPNLPWYRLKEETIPCDSLVNPANEPAHSITPADIRVWPVPAADILYFSAPGAWQEPLRLFLFDGFGRLVLERKEVRLSPVAVVRLDELPAGVYFYTLCDKSGRVIKSGKVIRT